MEHRFVVVCLKSDVDVFATERLGVFVYFFLNETSWRVFVFTVLMFVSPAKHGGT